MDLTELHAYVRESVVEVVDDRFTPGLRALLESGSSELLLTDLLFLVLCADFEHVSREYPLGGRAAADLVVHRERDLVIEIKQLHLKDGCKFAPPNLSKDLARHDPSAVGVMYVLDERSSTLPLAFSRFGGTNRTARADLASVLAGLSKNFAAVFPSNVEAALLRRFEPHGRLDLYAFVVQGPQ